MVRYADAVGTLRPEQLVGFFEGWPHPPAADTHLQLLRSSTQVALALDRSGQVVGFATAISDGVLTAYIPYLEVLASHRGRGIGTELVRRVLGQLEGL